MIDAEYPLASCVPAHESNYRKAGRAGYSLVIIHITDGHENAQPVAEMWQEPEHGSSAHYVVGQQGEVIQAVSVADVAWHAHQCNGYSVGVEHSARTPGELGPGDPGLRPSTAQLAASAKLAAWLLRRAGLEPSADTIKGHAQADPQTTHRQCPDGCGWPWTVYMAMVQQEWEAWDSAS